MKRMIAVLCVMALVLLAVPFPAYADVIFEPYDDLFYSEHGDECEYHSRSYYAAGPNGDVTVYESPESAREEAVVENGQGLWISHIYTAPGGVRWGYYDDWQNDVGGWVPMDYLELIYDGISFEEEYGDQFVKEDGVLDGSYAGKTIYFWDYPGCETASYYTLSEAETFFPEYYMIYTDPEGRSWGKLSYFMGHKNSWICLDDPTADFNALYPAGNTAPEAETTPVSTEGEPVVEIVPQENHSLKWIAAAAVGMTVVVTAVLLYLLKKKKN